MRFLLQLFMHEGVYMKENITFLTSELQKLIDTIGTFQTAWGLIVTFFILIVFVVCVLAFRYNVNNASKIQIRKFEKEGKYLSSVYDMLNCTVRWRVLDILSFHISGNEE